MPDSLKVHSGERVDLVDYVQGANTYTKNVEKFAFERAWLDRRSRVLDGFRVRVEDQTAFPGMITVFNGNALDRDGQLINNEQVVNDSRSITLLGAGLNFYVEIEFIENTSSTDARFFWDPTIPNTAPEPDGSEFGLNVATRLTPDWRIVTPVSTTGFEQATNANSIRVPIGVFRTDGANRISTGATNPGLTLVRPASVLEVDVDAADVDLRVVDARLYPTTPFNVDVDFGSGTVEARTVTGIDRTNGVLTVSVGLTNAHNAGAIIRSTGGTADLVQEKLDPSDPALDSLLAIPGHPDLAQRIWQANEVRGSGLIASKETFGDRDDLNLRSLKDYVDFLSAQVRELKFGSPRPEDVNTAPPLIFATRPRYFDQAGGVQGARSNSVSIGNGTTSFGDFNGTNGTTLLTDAIAALPASGGTIFVKAGTYDFATTVTLSKTVRIVGEGVGSVIFNITNAAGPGISISASTTFENLTIQRAGGAFATTVDVTSAVTVGFHLAAFSGQFRCNAVAGGIRAYRTAFTTSSGALFVETGGGSLANSMLTSCTFAGGICFLVTLSNVVIVNCVVNVDFLLTTSGKYAMTNVIVSNSTVTVVNSVVAATGTGAVEGVDIHNCRVTVTNLLNNGAVFSFLNTGVVNRVSLRDLVILVTNGASTAIAPAYILKIASNLTSRKLSVDNIDVDAYVGSFVRGVLLDQDDITDTFHLTNSYFYRTQEMLRIGGAVGTMNSVGGFRVSGCVHDNVGEHDTAYGVVLDANPVFERLEVLDSIFSNYDKNGGPGERIALSLNSTTGIDLTFIIKGNSIYNIGYGSGTIAAGVYYAPGAAVTAEHRFQISDNDFAFISSNTTNISAGVYIRSSLVLNETIDISHNRIAYIGEFGSSSGTTYGIFVDNVSGTDGAVNIAKNHIWSVISSSAAAPASGIQIGSCSHVNVEGNYVATCNSPGGSTFNLGGCGIRLYSAGVLLTGVQITNNRIDQSIAGTAAEAQYNILVCATQLDDYSVVGNTVRTSTVCPVGIWIRREQDSAALKNGVVSNNVVSLRSTSSGVKGIYGYLGGSSINLVVSDNIVEETTYSASCTSHVGIQVEGHNTGGNPRNVAISDNIVSGAKSGALLTSSTRIGIKIQDLRQTKVSGNIVDWNEPAVLEGIGIAYVGALGGPWAGHLCVGNFVRSDNSAAPGGEVDIDTANMIDGFFISNQLGITGAAGNVVPPAAAGGWTYGPAGTNKF